MKGGYIEESRNLKKHLILLLQGLTVHAISQAFCPPLHNPTSFFIVLMSSIQICNVESSKIQDKNIEWEDVSNALIHSVDGHEPNGQKSAVNKCVTAVKCFLHPQMCEIGNFFTHLTLSALRGNGKIISSFVKSHYWNTYNSFQILLRPKESVLSCAKQKPIYLVVFPCIMSKLHIWGKTKLDFEPWWQSHVVY